ncbi:MAG: flavodoxin [Methanobrevibacter thaueri]|nr:flavodoxin [Methanobrevibacter thaueri]
MKSLVVYYSRTNITKKLAEDIASKINADVEEIKSKTNYKGKIGFIKGGKDAISEKIVDLEELKYNPEEYDIVYLGCPVWASKAANPMISYLKQNEGKFKKVKFFTTAGGDGFESTFKQMEKYSIKPEKTFGLTTKQVKKEEYDLTSFIN